MLYITNAVLSARKAPHHHTTRFDSSDFVSPEPVSNGEANRSASVARLLERPVLHFVDHVLANTPGAISFYEIFIRVTRVKRDPPYPAGLDQLAMALGGNAQIRINGPIDDSNRFSSGRQGLTGPRRASKDCKCRWWHMRGG
jgi:hypothetical protein